MFDGARILVAPLDWGLGHAARCVPVIGALLEAGAVPVIGADKAPLALLRDAFPKLEHARLPGLEVRYAGGGPMAWAMARQLPALLRQAGREQHLFRRLLPGLRLRAVISDQRFGIRAAALPSVLITHQVFPRAPFLQAPARWYNRRQMARFSHCWIPDHAAPPGLAGALSHGPAPPPRARYIGPLSRFAGLPGPKRPAAFRVVAVVSGPEPQRGMLEQILLAQLRGIEGEHLLVSGQPGAGDRQQGNVRVLGHLPAAALHGALAAAELIVARCGYSTLMDLAAMGRGALLVPTPGQPEQEYLGQLHGQRGMHRVQAQERLHLAAALAAPPPRAQVPPISGALLPAMTELARSIASTSAP